MVDLLSVVGLLFVIMTCLHPVPGSTVGMHRAVPFSCPPNRTRLLEQPATGKTILGELQVDELSERASQAFNRGLELRDNLFVDTGGIYLHSEPIPHDATVVSVRSFGYIKDEILSHLFFSEDDTLAEGSGEVVGAFATLYVLVYRPDQEGREYSLVHGPNETTHQLTPAILPESSGALGWEVKKGDMIGVFIPDSCEAFDFGLTRVLKACPSQVNFVTLPLECLSALYSPLVGDSAENVSRTISASDFEEVQLRLNLEVTLTAEGSSSSVTISIVIAVAVAVIVTLLVLSCLMLLCWWCSHRHRAQWKLKSVLPLEASQQEVKLSGVEIVGTDVMLNGSTLKKDSLASQNTEYSYEYDSPLSPQETLQGYTVMTDVATPTTDGYTISNEYDYQEPYFEPANMEEDLMAQLCTKLAVTEIPREELKLCEVLGSGAFGTVYRGVWLCKGANSDKAVEEEVAVKTMEHEDLSEADKIKFLQEAAIMAQFKHTNIVTIRGILTDKQLMIVVDLMRGGDLRQYLLTTVRERLNIYDPLELASTLLSYSRQIALGLVCMEHKSFVHRDLAARNVLMSKDGMICKIADFGLSRDLQKETFYVSHGGKVPVKWTAPEALNYRKYSPASDVWSYGCVLYEIWSLGEKPFQELTNQEAMKKVMSGFRLPPPPGCPKSLYSLMIRCWHPDCDKRPTISDIIQQLQQSDFHILKWIPEDVAEYSKETRTIGSPMKLGAGLYRDLQRTYLVEPEIKQTAD